MKDQAIIRQWAREQGIAVGARGRLPKQAREAYVRLHQESPEATDGTPSPMPANDAERRVSPDDQLVSRSGQRPNPLMPLEESFDLLQARLSAIGTWGAESSELVLISFRGVTVSVYKKYLVAAYLKTVDADLERVRRLFTDDPPGRTGGQGSCFPQGAGHADALHPAVAKRPPGRPTGA
jgi:hypothetical protein